MNDGYLDIKEQDWGVDENSWVSDQWPSGGISNGFTGG